MAGLFRGQGLQLIAVTRRSAGRILRKRWGLIVILLAGGSLTGAASTSFAELISRVINSIDAGGRGESFFEMFDREQSANSPVAKALIETNLVTNGASALVACLVLALIVAGIAAASGRARAIISSQIYCQLREDAFARCFDQASAVDAALREEGGDAAAGAITVASSLNRGADSVSNTYTYLLACGQQLFALASAIVTSGTKMWAITLACASLITLQILLSQTLARKLKESRRSLDKSTNLLQSQTAELLNAREVLLAFDKAENYKNVLKTLVGAVASLQAKTETVETRFAAIQNLINLLGQLALLGLVALLVAAVPSLFVAAGDQSVATPPMVFAITFYGTLLAPSRELIQGYDAIRRSEAVVGSFLAIFSVDPDRVFGGNESGWTVRRPIVLKEVSFTPPGSDRPVLNALNLLIPPCATTLILGPSGCGKTTIGRLCLGFLTPDSGTIEIGGGRLSDWAYPYLHKAMSYAPQVDQILAGSIEDNLQLAYDDRPFERQELERVLDMVELKCGQPDRLAMDARKLSGGETQRLSAARILLDRAEILVLDEPMAGVDVFTMSDIAPAIEQHWQETRQTVLLISHKLVFASVASHVVILAADGSVVEQGNPVALREQDSVYARLQAEAVRQAGG